MFICGFIVDTKFLGSYVLGLFHFFSVYLEIRSSVTLNFQSSSQTSAPTCLILMVDTRPLDHDLSTAFYNSISAVVNSDYADRFGCDFNYLIPYLDTSGIPNVKVESEWEWKGPKLRPSCYHPLLKIL